MLVALVESVKYVGHLFPLAFLRIFVGYTYFNQALVNLQSDYLTHAYLAEDIRNYLPRSTAPGWFRAGLENIVIANWRVFAVGLTVFYLLVGISFIAGYLVRPFSILALLVGICVILAVGTQANEIASPMILALLITLGWMGAGRCLGLDYYFFKRRRGLWW